MQDNLSSFQEEMKLRIKILDYPNIVVFKYSLDLKLLSDQFDISQIEIL